MKRRIARSLQRLVQQERGFALVIALGATTALAVVGTSVVAYSSTNYGGSVRSKADQSAYVVAEAGVNDAVAVLSNPNNNPLDASLLPLRTTQYDTGTATWSGSLDKTTAVWRITSTGTLKNPTGAVNSTLSRTVVATVTVGPAPAQTPVSAAWSYVFSTRTGTTCDLNVSSYVQEGSPLYSAGTLCLAAGAKVTGGPFVALKNVNLSGADSAVGASAAAISEAHIAGSCKYATNVAHLPCSSADNVWATVLDQNAPVITPPTPFWDTYYQNAMPGPKQPCTTVAGNAPAFDSDTTRNNSLLTSVSLTPTTSYTCRVGPDAAPLGELSWDASSHTLTVRGNVFIDGSAKVDNGLLNTYRGIGTLYLSGTFLMSNNSKLCARAAGTDCDFANWNPGSGDELFVIANGNGGQVSSGNSIQLASYSQFEGGLYATNAITIGGYAKVKAPMVATTEILSSYVQTFSYPLPRSAPAGIPGNTPLFAVVSAPTYSG